METEKELVTATVVLLMKNDEVLLAIKTRKIGAGCWNGYGGGVKKGEDLKTCAVRELEEESGRKVGKKFITTKPESLEKVAIAYFHNEKSDGSSYLCCVHFYITRDWEGIPVDTDEMINTTPFNIDNLPEKMMPADAKFIPLVLHGSKIIVRAHYTPFQKELIGEVEIEYVDEFPED